MVELNSSTGASIGTTAIASPCNIPTSATYQTTNGANIWFLSGTTVCTFNTVSLSVSTAIALSGSSYYIFTLSPNGLTFWVATYGAPSTIYQYSATSTPQLLKTISNSSTCYPYGMQVAPDNQSLWIGNLCGSATGIDIATPSLSTNISGMGTDVYGVAISPDGSQVWVYSANSVNELSYTPLITYAGGTGVGTAPIQSSASAEVAGSFSVAANTFTKTGYTFLGWTDGSTTYQPGSTYTMSTTNVTLTAVWASPPIQYSKPTAPLSVSAQLNGNAATISFTPGSTGNLATYNEIDMYVNGAPTGDVCNVAIIATCVVGNLAPNTTYTFSITATNNLGSATSVISNAVSYAAPTTTTTTTVPVTTTTVASTHTIICVKGNAMKKVTGVNPVCPSGFKRK